MQYRMLLAWIALLGLLTRPAMAGEFRGSEWLSAQPLVVHEWGVHVFDWQGNSRISGELPAFMYTDAKPGLPVPVAQHVKDLPPDSGMRFKPILYFYPQGYRTDNVPVGVEVRFAFGHANAWWPQVSQYRTPAQVAQAVPVDWPAWQAMHRNRIFAPLTKVPDDERFELVWYNLTLTPKAPPNLPLAGGDLPADHWVQQAREVDSHFVSNGKEAEKFLFYEGKTTEKPAFTILPPDGGVDDHYHLVNVSDFPLYDVFAIYRDTKRGVVWMRYLAELPPVPTRLGDCGEQGTATQITALPIPDVAHLPGGTAAADQAVTTRARERLLEALTAGEFYSVPVGDLRDPADFQPPTRMAQLYPAEARALEAIWHKDFFTAEGLTVLYRESPAYLDQAMPLRLFTDMHHFIKLSRCGLVLNQRIPLEKVKLVDETVTRSRWDMEKRDAYLATVRQHRFLAQGLARFYVRQSRSQGYTYINNAQTKATTTTESSWYASLVQMLEWVKE
ncbi:MAG: hypothetical protein ACYDBB_26225 [Armatimonadota bacterium]